MVNILANIKTLIVLLILLLVKHNCRTTFLLSLGVLALLVSSSAM